MKLNRGDYVHGCWFFHVSGFIFEENHVLIKENNSSEKIVTVEEELGGIDRDCIENLQDLLTCSSIRNAGILK